jgi:hypothetical protein
LQHSRSIEELKKTGHCLTDIRMKTSTITGADQGLFAVRSFSTGEVVSISPVLVMGKHILSRSDANSVLVNYALSVNGSDVSLIPFGRAGMANHGGSSANLRVEWYDWPSRRSGGMPLILSEKTIEELESAPFAPLDVSYRALRDISEGEELTIDYGPAWEAAWSQYVKDLASWTDAMKDAATALSELQQPVFRHTIGIDASMYPSSWYIPCIGHDCALSRKANTESCSLYMASSSIPGKLEG